MSTHPIGADLPFRQARFAAGSVVAPERASGVLDRFREGVGRASSLEGLPVLHLLVVDDDDSVRNACCEIARKLDFAVVGAADIDAARTVLKHQKVDLILLDLKIPGGGGLSLLEDTRTLYPDTSVIVMTAFATVSSAVEAMRIGAGDYLTKPFALEELVAILERAGELRHFDIETRRLREKLRNGKGGGHLIGHSPEMEKVYRILSKVAHSAHPVLIAGETGTGKELVARQIHFNGPNSLRQFVPIDCGSLVPAMIEAELFGYSKGTFGPGHPETKEGLLSAVDGGTIYLDEIGELPLELQAKLLRALQERTFRPLGSSTVSSISARVLASSSRDLMLMVEQGRFRKDLFFRLNVVNLRIPPLRERKQDLPLLAQHFLDRTERETGVAHTLSDDALHILMAYDWPGNVRELEGALERACALSSGPILHLGDLPTQLQDMRMHRGLAASEPDSAAPPASRIVSIADLERAAILHTIRQLKGDKLMAARLLGIGKTTLYRKLKEYGIGDGSEAELQN